MQVLQISKRQPPYRFEIRPQPTDRDIFSKEDDNLYASYFRSIPQLPKVPRLGGGLIGLFVS